MDSKNDRTGMEVHRTPRPCELEKIMHGSGYEGGVGGSRISNLGLGWSQGSRAVWVGEVRVIESPRMRMRSLDLLQRVFNFFFFFSIYQLFTGIGVWRVQGSILKGSILLG